MRRVKLASPAGASSTRRSTRSVTLALALIACTLACRTSPDQKWFVEGTYMDRELGEVTSDVVTTSGQTIGEVDIPDVPQERLGVRFGVRSRDSGWHFQAFSEEFGDVIDLVGFGFGTTGFSAFTGEDEGLRWGLTWGADIALAAGDGDILVVDSSGNVVGTANQELFYLGLGGLFGIGLDVNGFRPSVGLMLDTLVGTFETAGLGDGSFSAVNLGPYVGVEYISDEVPVIGRLRLGFGDLEGVALGIGMRF